MPQESLRKNPLCCPEDLGKPIPSTRHAISMCLPRWQDVIGYEERNPATMAQLQLGYPRFLYHPLVEQAFTAFSTKSDEQVHIYSTHASAARCRSYLLGKNPKAGIELRSIPESLATLISYPAVCADDAKDYWQHAGEGISSRYAEALLEKTPLPDASEAHRQIIARLAGYTEVPAENIYLFPSGMAAIHAALLMMKEMHADRPTVQFAFPYGDTLKLQERLGNRETLFYPRGDTADMRTLEAKLEDMPISGLFCEFPTNPLLTCVDIPRLRDLADARDFPLIIDETLGACINQDVLRLGDASVISLTKFFSGTSDVMGGALIVNPAAPFAERFSELLDTFHEPEAFHPADIIQLAEDSVDCRERVLQINETALELCGFLDEHPAIEKVHYPALKDREIYDRLKRPGGGYGGLLSFVLKDAEKYTEAFYDTLQITKGPNLGTSFSLCCPFTLIAHYNELDWAESAGASRYLIRLSVGLEPAAELTARIQAAIDVALIS